MNDNRFITCRLSVALLAMLTFQSVRAAVVPTAADIPVSYALGAMQDDTVWYRGIINNTSFRGSGILIRGQDYDYVITAGHAVSTQFGIIGVANMSVGDGSSYLTHPGNTSGISSIYLSPTYTTGNNDGEDYAFLRLSTRISSPALVFTLGATPAEGALILFSGYGLPGAMSGETITNTGNVMGFYARYSPTGPVTWNEACDTGIFNGQPDSGFGNTRDSGGSVKAYNILNNTWGHIGLMIGSNFSNTTIFYSFGRADSNFINFLFNTVRPAATVAESPQIACTVNASSAQLSFTKLETNREYRILRSFNLSGWEEAHRFTATDTTGSWSEGLATEGRRFYRMEWNE